MFNAKVKRYLDEIRGEGVVSHFVLVDPDETDFEKAEKIAEKFGKAGAKAFLVGGTLGVNSYNLDEVIKSLKRSNLPIIIFPSNINMISRNADAIFFMSMLNSDDIYFIIGAQTMAAPIIRALNLETIPTAYLIIGYGGTAAHIGRARPIPFENYELACSYVLAAQMLGMKYIYLEAGSGSPKPVDAEMVKILRKTCGEDIYIIVGGGIRSKEQALRLAESGADALVTGTLVEEDPDKAIEISESLSNFRRKLTI